MTADPRAALRESWLDPEDDPARIRALRSHRRGGLAAPASLGAPGDRPAGVLDWPFEAEVWVETHDGEWIPVGETGHGPLVTPACRRLEVGVTCVTTDDHGTEVYSAIRAAAISDLVLQLSIERGLGRRLYESLARGLENLPRLDRLTYIDTHRIEHSRVVLERIPALSGLRTLRLVGLGGTTPIALLNAGCPRLERLEVHESRIRGADRFLNLARLPAVHALDFSDSSLETARFRFDQEGTHPDIRELSLQRLSSLNSYDYDSLPKAYPNLEALNISGVEKRPRRPAFASELPRLRRLHLSHLDTRHKDFLSSLSDSELRALHYARNRVTPEDAARMAAISSLEELILHDCSPMSNEALAELAPLKRLKKLNLSNCRRITNRGLETLPELTALETLELRRGWQVTDRGMPALARCGRLRRLGLAGCAIADEGIRELAKLPLTTLNLWGCEQLTDAALLVLARMPTLRQLNLLNCPRLSARALDLLAAARPDMQIARPTGRSRRSPPHSRGRRRR